MNDSPRFSAAWIQSALQPYKGRRMAVLQWLVRLMFGRDYFAVVGRR